MQTSEFRSILENLECEVNFIKTLFDIKSAAGRLPDCKRRQILLSKVSVLLDDLKEPEIQREDFVSHNLSSELKVPCRDHVDPFHDHRKFVYDPQKGWLKRP